MWCTRWFLPLLLLPLPTAPPYFLLLFLFSLTMHAKPCFYCIVLLTTLFVSSCYWQPFPLNSPLSTPWADNITTFAEALHSTLAANYSKPLPNVMRTVDRCWCDFNAGGLFEPFNVTHWEYVSVQRLKDDLERKEKAEEVPPKGELETPTSSLVYESSDSMPRTETPEPTSLLPPLKSPPVDSRDIRSIIHLLRYAFMGGSSPNPSSPSDAPLSRPSALDGAVTPIRTPSHLEEMRPLIRKEYDLRPYGLCILVDFGWTR